MILKSLIWCLLGTSFAWAGTCAEFGYGAQAPWVAYGQTTMPTQSITNPATNHAGLLGEVSLPYTVPTDKVLIVETFLIEPYYGAAIIPFIGDTDTTTNALATLSSNESPFGPTNNVSNPWRLALQRSPFWGPFSYHLPAGLTFGIDLNVQHVGFTYGWYIGGKLCSVP